MKTTELPEKPVTRIDTSKMSAGQKAALEMAEAARDERQNTGLAAGLFFGEPDFSSHVPFSKQTDLDKDQGDAFLARLRAVLDQHADPDAIDRTGEIPDVLLKALADIGAFGIKIPVKYGGLGLSQTNYSRAAMLLGSECGNLAALLSAHQSIGVPQPLILFGTEEQKMKFLPRCAKGEISAFALTEADVGSDPAKMTTIAVPEGPDHFIINGEKVWCTNSLKASLIVVMARTPTKDKPHATTAFIVEANAPGVEILCRCRFMGLRALYNGVVRFENVRVPRENILGGEGKGLKVALTTLNTGRITLPAACVGLAKRCVEISKRWASRRVQWGQPIGKHAAITDKLARMSADAFAMEAVVRYVSSLVDQDKHADVRLEAAIAKLWGSERAWEIVNDTMQIRGGRGYETADSLRSRGESPEPVERMMRDCRINSIFEGSSEIMRLFIAREALEPHLKIGADVVNSTLPFQERALAALRAGIAYSMWYPRKWLPGGAGTAADQLHPALRDDLSRIAQQSHKLARTLFHQMAWNGPALEKRQVLLGHLVDIGSELFVWTCTLGFAETKITDARLTSTEVDQLTRLVSYFGKLSRSRIASHYAAIRAGLDQDSHRLSKDLLSFSA